MILHSRQWLRCLFQQVVQQSRRKAKHGLRQSSGIARKRLGLLERLEDRVLLSGVANVSIGDASITEGNAGTFYMVFPLTRTGDLSSAVSVNYSTSDNTATAGSDYTAESDTVVFAAGIGSATIAIPVAGDTLVEGNENFSVNLTGITDFAGPATATFAPKQQFSAGSAHGIAIGDFNGDGKTDVAVASRGANLLAVFLNTTTPGSSTVSFATPVSMTTGNAPESITAGDLNGDGKPDLLTSNYYGRSVSVFLNTTVAGASTPSFSAKHDITVPGTTFSTKIADLNGDGLPDLAITDFIGGKVCILLNETVPGGSTPSFSPSFEFTSGQEPVSISVADFNGDGKPDLAVSDTYTWTLSFLLNTTPSGSMTPSFLPHQDLGSFNRIFLGDVGDLNSDGKMDLAIPCQDANLLSVLLNTTPQGASTVTFTRQDYPVNEKPQSVKIRDLNGDGLPDIAVTDTGAQTISVFINQTVPGQLTTSFASKNDFSGGVYNVRYLEIADMNGDGKLDLVNTNDYDGFLAVLLNTFPTPSTSISLPPAVSFTDGDTASSVAIADFNNDGKPDLALPDRAAGMVSVFLNSSLPGNGDFNDSSRQDFATSSGSFAVAVGDFNLDGKPDLAITDDLSNTVSILLNTTPTGAALSFTNAASFSTGTAPRFVATRDLNGDGKPDIVVANYQSNTISILFNTTAPGTTTASFAAKQDFTTGTSPRSVSISDLNGDGKPDLAVANAGSNSVSVLLNTTPPPSGVFSFTPKTDFNVGQLPKSISIADVNGDGRPDLATSNFTDSTVSVLLNTTSAGASTPSFSARTNFSLANGAAPYSLTFGDINGDGRPDLAVANSAGKSISLLVNTTAPGASTPSFASNQVFSAGTTPGGIALGDLNGDGRLDFAVSDRGAASVSVVMHATAIISDAQAIGTIVNDDFAPAAVDLNGSDGNGIDFVKSFVENGPAVNIADSDATLTDTTATQLASLKVSILAVPDAGNESLTVAGVTVPLNTNLTGTGVVGGTSFQISYVAATHTLMVTKNGGGTAPIGDFQTLLRGITYSDIASPLNTTSRIISVTSNDGTGDGQVATTTIHITPVNHAPTDLALSSASIPENQPVGTVIGTFSTTDPDGSNTFTVTLVTGAGSTDNASFTILNGQLKTAASFDFESQSSYSIRVRTTDQGGLYFEKLFTISVANVNEAPTGMALTVTSIAENSPIGTVVGTFSSADPDSANTFIYSLVAGTGSADNSAFSIVNGQLQTATPLSFAAKSSYAIRVRTTDQGSLTFEKQFVISVTKLDKAPTDITLTVASVSEHQAVGTIVGTLNSADPDVGDSFSYSLVPGAGSADNASFAIVNGQLQTNASFDFNTKNSYSVRIQTTDLAGLAFSKAFVIAIYNVNDSSTDINLSASTVPENSPIGAAVGTLSSVDPDAGDAFTYSLVAGVGSNDNFSFSMVNGQLQSAASFDFETKNSYSIRVRTTDRGGLSFEKQFTISVTNVNDPPTDIALSSSVVAENSAIGTVIGAFSSTDQDSGNTFTYTLVIGAGGTGNSNFAIVNGQLQTAAAFDFESQNSYSVRVRTTDQGGLTFDKPFTISITDVNEAPTNISLPAASIAENQAVGTVIGAFSSTDSDSGNTFTYSLVTGAGGTDNSSFSILNGQLVSAASFDFEAQGSYSIRVQSTDQGGLSVEKSFVIAVTNVNEAPSISTILSQTIDEDTSTGVLNFLISDPESPAGSLTVDVTSSNPALIPNANLVVSGSGANRGINVMPLANQNGAATITIKVSDGTNTSTMTFNVTVNAVDDAPTSTSIGQQSILEDNPIAPLNFQVADIDNPVSSLTVSATSSNPSLIPDANIVLSGTGANRSLVVTPAANQNGVATITVTVSDGTRVSSQTFQLTVQAVDDPPVIALNAQPLVFLVAARKAVAIDGTSTISDIDTPTLSFTSSVLKVSGQSAKDTLSVVTQGGIGLKGKNVLSGKVIIGTIAGGTKGAPLTITLNAAATQASVQQLLRNLSFKAVDKVSGTRTLQIQITNVGGQSTNQATKQIQVTP